MDSYTTDAVSLAKKISVHSSVTISAVVRVIDVHNFMLDFFLTLMIFRFPIFQKIILLFPVFVMCMCISESRVFYIKKQ